MKTITLTGIRGGVVLVDDADFEHLSRFKWNHAKTGYAVRYEYLPVKRVVLMHRELCGLAGLEVDHIDGNKLNNQRSNLRVCDRRTNATNSGKRYPRGKYGRNVAKMGGNRPKPFIVQCWYYGKNVFGGYYATVHEAQQAAEALRRRLNYVE